MKTSDNTIFVNIASYRDPELCPTLLSLIHYADRPENLRIVICWQDDGDIQQFLDAGLILMTHTDRLYQFNYGGAQLEVIAYGFSNPIHDQHSMDKQQAILEEQHYMSAENAPTCANSSDPTSHSAKVRLGKSFRCGPS